MSLQSYTAHEGAATTSKFRDFLKEVKPIRFREPLAETLGASEGEDKMIFEYSFIDVVKMAGHACPTVAGAYLSCQKALEHLYPDETPVRGEIAVTIHGEPDEGVYGVMGQVFAFLTGAAPETGFKGLGYKFKRKDLLRYVSKTGSDGMHFEFRRLDNQNNVVVRFQPWKVPFPPEKGRRMGELLEKVVWEAAKPEERRELQDLWMEKVRIMVVEQKEVDQWLTLDEVS